jgi:HK97 family phage major capsid protein
MDTNPTERRDALLAEARELVRSGGDLHGAELERFEAIESELDHLEQQKREQSRARLRAAIESGDGDLKIARGDGDLGARGDGILDRGPDRADARGRALRHLESRQQPVRDERIIEAASRIIDSDRSAAFAARAAVLSDPDYTSAFLRMMIDPERGHLGWTPAEAEAWRRVDQFDRSARAMSEASSGVGGALVPLTLDPSIVITGAGSINPVRQIARIVSTPSNTWQGVTAAQVTSSFDAENSEVSDDSPTLSAPSIPVFTERAFLAASFELVDDVPNFANEVAMLFGDAIDNLERDKFTNGTGSAEPNGVLHQVENTTASRVAATTTSQFGSVDVYRLVEGLPARHQDNANWMASLPILNKMRQMATGTGPQSAFWSDWAGPQLAPAKLLGLPIWQNSAMPTVITTNADILLVGNFQRFVVVDHVGHARLETISNLLGTTNGRPTGQRGFLLWKRCGSATNDVDAFRALRT